MLKFLEECDEGEIPFCFAVINKHHASRGMIYRRHWFVMMYRANFDRVMIELTVMIPIQQVNAVPQPWTHVECVAWGRWWWPQSVGTTQITVHLLPKSQTGNSKYVSLRGIKLLSLQWLVTKQTLKFQAAAMFANPNQLVLLHSETKLRPLRVPRSEAYV